MISSKIDTSNIIRQRSMRASKDKAIARIAMPFDEPPPKRTINRSKTVLVRKTYKEIDEIETKMRTRLSISANEDSNDEDDDKDNFNASESESSESDESISSEDEDDHHSLKPLVVNNGIIRRKTYAGGKVSVATPSKSNIIIKKTERKRMTMKSFSEEMPCRDREFDQIYLSVSNLVCNGDGGCIFVVGVPGTGKTATVSAVLDCMESKEANIPQFNRVEINGMHVTEVREVYSLIYKELTDKKVSKNRAVSCLESELMKKCKNKRCTVILIDEIDQLHTKKEDVLYKIFGWTQKRESRLIIIAIANTMDMPERLTQNKVTSRSGLTRFIFQAYTHEQLLIILMTKITKDGSAKNIDPKALEFAAKKVAGASGDVRRILEIFRRIFQLQKEGKSIDMEMIRFIINEMFAQPKIKAMRENCSFYEKMFLKAVVTSFKVSGLEEAMLKDVTRHMSDLCKIECVRAPNSSETMQILISLGSYKLLLFDSLSKDIFMKLRLNCSQENVHFALNNK